MILVDANLLIYAVDRDSPHHAKARAWLEELLSGTTAVGFAWVVLLAFPILRNLLRMTGAAGNLVSDAHLAAIALEQGATIHSTDHDFRRFPGVEQINPIE